MTEFYIFRNESNGAVFVLTTEECSNFSSLEDLIKELEVCGIRLFRTLKNFRGYVENAFQELIGENRADELVLRSQDISLLNQASRLEDALKITVPEYFI